MKRHSARPRHGVWHRLLWVPVLLLLAGGAWATVVTEVVPSPTTVAPGQQVTITVTVQSTARSVENATLTYELYENGDLVSSHTENVQVNPEQNDSPGITRFLYTYRLPNDGSYMVKAILSGTDVNDPQYPLDPPVRTDFTSSRVAYFTVTGVPITVSPKDLTLQGAPGDTASTPFVITSGVGPFSLSSANPDGRGTFSNDQPDLNEPVTYSFRIPSTATDQDQFTDFITITDANGVSVTIRADITVSGGGGGDIGDALDDIARTPPQKEIADTIAVVCPSGAAEPRLQQDCNALVGAALDPAAAPDASKALAQVTADQASAPVDAAHVGIRGQGRNVGSRLAALRGGALGISTQGLTLNLNGRSLPLGRMADALLDDLKSAHGGAAGSDSLFESSRLGVFLNGTIAGGDKDQTRNESGFSFDSIAITLGADYRLTDQFVAGVALGYNSDDTDLDHRGGYLDSDGYSLSLYGTWFQPTGLYLDGILTWGRTNYDQARNIRYQLGDLKVDQTAYADFDGTQWSAAFGGGYSFDRGPWSITPSVHLEYISADVDSFNERMKHPDAPGGGWAVHVNDQSMDSFTSQVGVDLSRVMSQSWGVMIPTLTLEWVHEFKDNPGDVVGYFLQDDSRTLFRLPTDDYDNDYFNLGVGVSGQFANGWSGFVQYRQLFGYSDLDLWTLNLGVRKEL